MTAKYLPGVLYTPTDYLRQLQISKQKRLLVEGSDDKELFLRLLHHFFADCTNVVVVDTAEQLRNFDPPTNGIGNREKVEEICRLADALPNAGNLVGFVDREFRDFDSDPDLQDRLPNHRLQGRLVWSRGHSIENYLFDFQCFQEKAEIAAPADNLGPAIRLFQQVFPDAICVACAVGLTGYHHPTPNLRLMSGTMTWKCLRLVSNKLALDIDQWKEQLLLRHLPQTWINEAERQYNRWWSSVSSADYEVVRWLCHGHIGVAAIWAAFGRCVYEVSTTLAPDDRAARATTAMNGDRQDRFRSVVQHWVKHALMGNLDCPSVLFQMLGLPNPAHLQPGTPG